MPVTLTALIVGAAALSASAPVRDPAALAPRSSPILAGRLTLRLPEGARQAARPHGIMEADEDEADASRAVLDDGPTRFVLMAHELHARRGANFRGAVAAEARRAWPEAQRATAPEPLGETTLPGYGVPFQRPEKATEANPVYAAYVSTGDGLVQLLVFYVNPAGVAEFERWQAVARAVTATLAAGPRVPDLRARRQGFPGVERDDTLVLEIPEGVSARVEPGPDFDVLRFRWVPDLGVQSPSCMFYQGAHPRSFRDGVEEQGKYPQPEQPVDGRVLGSEVRWAPWTLDGRTTAELVIPYPGKKQFKLHLSCSAPTPGETRQALRIFESLRVEPR